MEKSECGWSSVSINQMYEDWRRLFAPNETGLLEEPQPGDEALEAILRITFVAAANLYAGAIAHFDAHGEEGKELRSKWLERSVKECVAFRQMVSMVGPASANQGLGPATAEAARLLTEGRESVIRYRPQGGENCFIVETLPPAPPARPDQEQLRRFLEEWKPGDTN